MNDPIIFLTKFKTSTNFKTIPSSISPSISPSLSPSISPSISPSLSPSISPSLSPSISPSISPSSSEGDTVYTRGDEAVLPANDADLETNYSEQDIIDVATKNNVRVGQTATDDFAIHQYKDFVGANSSCTLEWEGQSSLAPSSSIIKLQIYNQDSPGWEDVDSDNTTNADTDFTLSGNVPDLTDYKDTSGVVSCRVYQDTT